MSPNQSHYSLRRGVKRCALNSLWCKFVVRKSPFSGMLCPTEGGLEDSSSLIAEGRHLRRLLKCAKFHSSIHLVAYEYGYHITVGCFKAKYLKMKVEEDPFTKQLEDADLPMAIQAPFSNSLDSPP
ncbi:hypothetical protein B296_00014922 [Ensete ventricosum]|uniref:Uncharacterized protein n=1 Tax=Ensete ventricosum TaxID=4639 RepID=A0A426ZSK0_ENSVE|nr:hypothetical protein B296_00014922 [Ensete ventricosum]